MIFATCAKLGCYERIPYDETDAMRPRYCASHMFEKATRFGEDCDDLWIPANEFKKTKQLSLETTEGSSYVR